MLALPESKLYNVRITYRYILRQKMQQICTGQKGDCIMQKYVCEPCGYEYDPEVGDPDNGIAPGTAFEDLPEDWVCPICGVGKEEFVPAE